MKNYIGEKYGRLKILNEVEKRNGHRRFHCSCECGETKEVYYYSLRKGSTKSCGCYNSEVTAERNRQNKKHGHWTNYKGSPTYNSWSAMKHRCLNPKMIHYKHYGGRGIKIYLEWINSFDSFLKYMGERPLGTSLDRIDVNGNYEPGNVKWSTSKEQRRNRRK